MRIVEERIGKGDGRLKGYIHDDLSSICDTYRYRPAVIICPGGGYSHLSLREQDPVALPFFNAGFQVFILLYSIGEEIRRSEPEAELAEAVEYIKRNKDELNICYEKIAVMGFSAGGHLAASLACHWRRYSEECKPDCLVLCYPVITMNSPYAHKGSVDKITFGEEERRKYFSLETQVNPDTPACFIWHTTEDKSVPVQNSLEFINALTENDVAYEAHIFQRGSHGLALARKETGNVEENAQIWIELCLKWLNRRWNFEL